MIDLDRPRLAELRQSIAQMIPCEPEGVREDLIQMQLPELLTRFVNWRDRFVRPRPRQVGAWQGFWCSNRVETHAPAILDLGQRVTSGEDLTPYLSEDILRYGYVRPRPRKPGKRRGVEWDDKDYALNCYGVHHLHLNMELRPDGWSKRTKALLYAVFGRTSVCFVMVGDHKSFDNGTLADTVAQMQAAAGDEIKGILPGPGFTPKERSKLQRRGMATPVNVGGKVVVGAFLSAVGTALAHTRHSDRIMLTLEALDPRLDEPDLIETWFASAGIPRPDAPDFMWQLDGCDLCAVERTTGTARRMVEWCR